MMRTYFTEGDLISVCMYMYVLPECLLVWLTFCITVHFLQAEVQQVFSDGSLSLHTRSLKYGKVNMAAL